ncbi:hypothetical protein F4860DRAFT_516816 [Xylaria cubensis]|nr:hypothetical protein F4860DRAFT_516816 [Xylaria cubensis]
MSSQPEQGAVPVTLGETTFTGFSRLPTELRLMIWEEFIRIPRIIRICYFEVVEIDRRFSIEIDGRPREQACPLLRVNRESRHVALGEPLLLFSLISITLAERWESRHFGIRSCDVLLFDIPPCCMIGLRAEGDTDKIANIILTITGDINFPGAEVCWDSMIWEGVALIQELGNVQCLEKMYCLIRDVWTKPKKPQLPLLELNDLRDFDPSQFLPAGNLLTDYLELQELHQGLPESLDAWHRCPPERRGHIFEVLSRWKNVSLD